MTEPARLRDEGPEHVRALLRAGAPTRPMTAAQNARTAERVARYAATAGLAWAPAAALGAGAGAAIVIAAWVAPSLRSPSPPPSPPAAVPSPSALQGKL
jgi:ferric-dicitrate binding protein FerR (iron transport regulator)